MAKVEVYSIGLCHCSACAPADMTRAQIEAEVSLEHPTGLDHGWTVSDETTFRTGQPNPCQCEDDDTRQHWLMEC